MLELIQEGVDRFGVRLPIDGLCLGWRVRGGLDFLAEVALGRPVMTHLPERLDNGQTKQQLAQVILPVDGELPLFGAGKKSPENRLHDVFRIDTAGHTLAEPPARQGDQTVGIALEEFAGGLLIPPAP